MPNEQRTSPLIFVLELQSPTHFKYEVCVGGGRGVVGHLSHFVTSIEMIFGWFFFSEFFSLRVCCQS